MAVNWTSFCGTSNFTVWDSTSRTFGRCFEELVLTIGSHLLLWTFSLIHHLWNRHQQCTAQVPQSTALHLRFFISLLLCIFPIALLILTYVFEKLTLEVVEILSLSIQVVSWLTHSAFVWKLKRYLHIHIRGPSSLVIAVLSTSAALAVHVRALVIDVRHEHRYINAADEYISYVKCALHLAYILTLVPSKRPTNVGELSINNTSTEQTPLLRQSRDLATCINLKEAGKHANCFSKLFFIWINPLMNKGYAGGIQGAHDTFLLPDTLKTEHVDERFQSAISKQDVDNTYRRSSEPLSRSNSDALLDSSIDATKPGAERFRPSLIRALHHAFGWECYSLGILTLFTDALNFAGPLLLNRLVSYMENSSEATWHGYAYAGGLFTSTLLSALLSTHFNYRITLIGLKVRAALITSIYRKALKVNAVSMTQFSTGEVVNFMSTDTDRVVSFCPSLHQFWSLPLQVIVALLLLYQQLGLTFLAGLAFALLLIPINKYLANKIGALSTAMMTHKDSRVKVMSEILGGIRVIKFNSWEKHFARKVDTLRDLELASLKGRKYLDAWCVFFWACTPALISLLTFATYALLGRPLTAARVFTSVALFNILLTPLNAFPWVVNGLVEAWVSVKRLQQFFELGEQQLLRYYTRPLHESADPMIQIDRAQFAWSAPLRHSPELSVTQPVTDEQLERELLERNQRERSLLLRDISLSVPQGSLVGVVGKVGSGKSSLLHAILAEMNKDHGNIEVACLDEGFGLATQEVWIQHATVRENILFGRRFDEAFYEQVVDACALRDDLKVLPAGDQTEIGENGVTLSGGQKARVALARAVYQDKSVYLLDDPLAAVDAHVGKHLFTECIMGLLRHKTRILCTHHIKYLLEADHVIVMHEGRILKQGPPSLILYEENLNENANQAATENSCENDVTESTDDIKQNGACDDVGSGDSAGALVAEEEREEGVVKLQVYKAYWRAVGHCLAPAVLIAIACMQASRNVSDWWLSYWVTHSESRNAHHHNSTAHNDSWTSDVTMSLHTEQSWWSEVRTQDSTEYYLTVYGSLVGANLLFALIRAFLFAYAGICAATRVHKHLLGSILRAPVRFFDVTPLGRVINRFSSDLYAIDDTLPFMLNIFLAQTGLLLGSLVLTSLGLPWILIVFAPLAFVYYHVQRYYRVTSRELKRIVSVTLSPIYAHFTETVTGLSTIRAMRHSDRFEGENGVRLTLNQRAQLTSNIAGLWLGLRLQLIGVVTVTSVAFIAVFEHHFGSVNPGLVGLAITYALSVTSLLGGVVQYGTETEKQMVSVERARQYIEQVPAERRHALRMTPPAWPAHGDVVFENVVLQYRPSLPMALNGVTFHVKAGEKIGIVGRTGAGKSSLFLALFRMVELQSGSIVIDGVNVAHLPLDEVRSRLAIIPQDPFLFSGSVRENLDPTDVYSDAQLWSAVERCHVKTVVERLGGLDAPVAERGRQFSVGERQLFCLARALLSDTKVLCIDEATAAIDRRTDDVIQQTLRSEFAHATVLTIAHRLATVADSDRVLVMSAGHVAEFDEPQRLLADSDSLYAALVNS